MRFANTACCPASDEELLVQKDDQIEPDDLLQTKMYDWLPPWFKEGDSFFGIDKAVKVRLNDDKQRRRGVYAQLAQLEEEDLDLSPTAVSAIFGSDNQGIRNQRSGGSVLTGRDSEGDASRKAKIRFYRRFIEERVKLNREDEDEWELTHLPIPKHYQGLYQPGLFDVCGPPLKYFMPWATAGCFVASILVPVLAVASSHCEGKHEMLATYPYWLWLPFFLWVAIMELLEWKCFTYLVIPVIATSGPKRILWFKTSFKCWTCCSIFLSVVMQAEVWSQGLLAASAIRASLDCKGWRETLEPAWSKAWNDSSWKPFELGGNLLALAGLAWCFLVVKLVVYVFRAVPTKVIKCERVDYGCGAEPHGYAVPFCWMRVWHADAMKTLASLNRMVFLLDGQTEYAIKRAYFKLVSDPGERPYTFFHVLKMDMRIMLFDAFFINFLQNCAKLQFQTSYIAFLMYANLAANVNVEWTLLSLFLTHMTSAVSFFVKLREWAMSRDSRILVRKEFRKGMDDADWHEYDKLVFLQRSVALVLTLQFLFQSFCAVNFYMSQWHCESHLWSVFQGCVEGFAVVDGTNFD